jgi:cytochrome c peroxidase
MFKVPSLRNCVKTQPYFHDGSITDLNQAIIIMGKTQLNKDITVEQADIISDFLNTLSGDIPQDAKTPPAELGATM